jgi:hypothetical protein
MSRFDGQTYVEVGFMPRAQTVIGEAQIAACADVGPDAVGPYFPSNPETAEAWSVKGFDPGRVIALPQGRQMRVYASVDLPRAEQAEVAQEIARRGSRR